MFAYPKGFLFYLFYKKIASTEKTYQKPHFSRYRLQNTLQRVPLTDGRKI